MREVLNYSINSSKVYCKCMISSKFTGKLLVLIVAKCIVNGIGTYMIKEAKEVLIVAKCIVNSEFIYRVH